MKELTFTYTSYGPSPWRNKLSNQITLFTDMAGATTYRRNFIKDNGSVSSTGIEHTFDDDKQTPADIAKMINWGCTGVDRNSVELHTLISKVKPFTDHK